jgi:hypothetical protein
MRLFEYIENTKDTYEVTNDDNDIYVLDTTTMLKIKKECSDIIKIYDKSNRVLYRGVTSNVKINNHVVKLTPRTDRKPKDTNMVIHKIFDDVLYKKFGWRPRSEGIFCTSNIFTSASYGNVVGIVFPKNGFDYVWSHKVNDFYSDIIDTVEFKDIMLDILNKNKTTDIKKGEYTKEQLKYMNEIIKNTLDEYTNDYLENAVMIGNEVMIKCDYYYLLVIEDISVKDLQLI